MFFASRKFLYGSSNFAMIFLLYNFCSVSAAST
jgi:hypothetical protein